MNTLIRLEIFYHLCHMQRLCLFLPRQVRDCLQSFDMIDFVIANHAMRIETGVVNEIMAEAVALQQPPSDKGKRLKLYYITQVSVKPPTFVIFVN